MHRQQAVSLPLSAPSIRPAVRRPFTRRRPRPHPRNARPALCDTTSAAPARTHGARPPDNSPSNAPDRTATNGRSRAEDTPGPRASVRASVLSVHLKSRRQPAAPETPRPEPSPTPATRVAQTLHPAATHNAAWPRAERTARPSDGNTGHPHGRGRSRTRHPTAYRTLARMPPRILLELSPDIDVVAIVGTDVHRVLRAPEQLRLPRCRVRLWRRRVEPAAVVPSTRTARARAEAPRATFRHPSEQRSRCPRCGRALAILDAVRGIGDGKFLVLTAARGGQARNVGRRDGHHPDHDGAGCGAELGADATVPERSSTYSIRNGMRRPTSAPTTSS